MKQYVKIYATKDVARDRACFEKAINEQLENGEWKVKHIVASRSESQSGYAHFEATIICVVFEKEEVEVGL